MHDNRLFHKDLRKYEYDFFDHLRFLRFPYTYFVFSSSSVSVIFALSSQFCLKHQRLMVRNALGFAHKLWGFWGEYFRSPNAPTAFDAKIRERAKLHTNMVHGFVPGLLSQSRNSSSLAPSSLSSVRNNSSSLAAEGAVFGSLDAILPLGFTPWHSLAMEIARTC